MVHRLAESDRQQYAKFIDDEIENYKESLPRSALLSIGAEAVEQLLAEAQLTLTEIMLCERVDSIIIKRRRLPSFKTWQKKQIKLAKEKLADERRRPEHWGLDKDDPVVRTVNENSGESRVLLAGGEVETPALYFAANGCDVTALGDTDVVQRVIDAAEEAGLASRVHASAGSINAFTPDGPLTVVVYSPAAFAGMSTAERARVIDVLQSATADGGCHLIQTIAAGKRTAVSLEELRHRYRGWDVTVDLEHSNSFFARKAVNELAV